MNTTLRWIALVPGMILAIVLASLVTNLVLFFNGEPLISFTPDGSNQPKGLTFYIMAYLTQPALVAGAFVVAGRLIAPKGGKIVGWAAAWVVCLWVALTVALVLIHHVTVGFGVWVSFITYIVGSIIAATMKLEEL